eukprot:TRINITY_DN49942_c0_g1_i1.p1 TRINITY_DN49942_c0_g1~~TRINITY_DN49942_c0_g1_i1.p1  ORF type:complete len:1127 (+),score=490.78 TRINITY_DN49942_c0_g1_i1:74-3382(+)
MLHRPGLGTGVSPRTHSPRRIGQGAEAETLRSLEKQLREERRERQARERLAEQERAASAKKMEEMQLTIADFQVVLTSHEREVEALWARSGVRAGDEGTASATELAELRQAVARMAQRVEVVEARGAAAAGGRGEAMQASTMELLFAQNRELMDELEDRVSKAHDAAQREAARVDAQFAALREALQLSERQRDAAARDSEGRLRGQVAELRAEAAAAWDCFAAGLHSPATVDASGADGAALARACALRDSVVSLVTSRVCACTDALHREQEDRQRQSDAVSHRTQQQLGRQQQALDALAEELRALAARPSGVEQCAELGGQLSVLRSGVEQELSRVSDFQRELAERHGRAETTAHELAAERAAAEQRFSDINTALRQQERGLADAHQQLAAHRDEALRLAGDARAAAMAAQEQNSQALLRQREELRALVQRGAEESRAGQQAALERGAEQTRVVDALRAALEEQAAAVKRLAGVQHEQEQQRKDELFRQQQQVSETLQRAQQQWSEELHRAQRDAAQEMQRHEDGVTNLYRTVEELRAVQQRSLDEYHRQGDEHAQITGRLQQQIAEAVAGLKEGFDAEGDRLAGLVRTETSGLSEALARMRQELQERASSAERRLHDLEAALDSFRGRLRAVESSGHDSLQQQKVTDDCRQRLLNAESRLQGLDRWKGEAAAALDALDGRVGETVRQPQMTQLQHKLEEIDKRLHAATGAERDAVMRQLRKELEELIAATESRAEKRAAQLELEQGEQQNVLRELQRDVTRYEVSIRQTADRVRMLEGNIQQQLRSVQESVTRELKPAMDACQTKLSVAEAALEEQTAKLLRVENELRRGRSAEERRGEQMQQELQDAQRQVQNAARSMDEQRGAVRDALAKLEQELADARRALAQMETVVRERCGRDELRDGLQGIRQQQASEFARVDARLNDLLSDLQKQRAEVERALGDAAGMQGALQKLDAFAHSINQVEQDLNQLRSEARQRELDTSQAMHDARETRAALEGQLAALVQKHEGDLDELRQEHEEEMARLRESMSKSAQQLQELSGYVKKSEEDNKFTQLQEKLLELQVKVEAEMTKSRRLAEMANAQADALASSQRPATLTSDGGD